MKTKRRLRATLAILAALALGSAAPASGDRQGRYAVTASTGVGEAALRAAIDPLFDDDVGGRTRALLVLHRGRIVAERYAPGFGPESRMLSWSVGKCVTAVLVGLMVSDGRLSLDQPAPVPAWGQTGDPRGRITLRQLLHMASGLDHAEERDADRMLFTDGSRDMAAHAEGKPLAHQPGSAFAYSTATTMILSDMMTRMLTSSADPAIRRDAMMQFVEGRLKQPVGLASLTPEFDAHGTMIGGAMMHMTARDYGRFGEFLRNRGQAEGRQILSRRWVAFMTAPSSTNGAYGGHLWLNREGAGDVLFPGSASSRLYGCVGRYGQYVLVSPGQELTVVRLGITAEGEDMAPLRAALAAIVALFPG